MPAPLLAVKYTALWNGLRAPAAWVPTALLLVWCVGIFGRAYWTPDEPREADIAWRMSWQADKAVPLLAGEAFCEKPPLTYWLAAVPIRLFGAEAWSTRAPNLLYAAITALAVGWLARRSAGRTAGFVGAAAMSTFLLSYQVAIWGDRCAAARRGVDGTVGRLPRFLCGAEPRTLAWLPSDARRFGSGLFEQERRRLDGAGADLDDLDRVGKALARAAALGALSRIDRASSDDRQLGLV